MIYGAPGQPDQLLPMDRRARRPATSSADQSTVCWYCRPEKNPLLDFQEKKETLQELQAQYSTDQLDQPLPIDRRAR